MHFSGPTSPSSGEFYVKGVYEADGLYRAQYVPKVAGDYTVHVTLLGVDVSGSPYNIVVLPGEISSLDSYTTIISAELLELEAGITYLFTLQLVDIYRNLLIAGNHGSEIEILALY